MYDTLLNLYSGTPTATAGVVAGLTGKFLGRNRTFRAIGRVGGDVSGAGAACTVGLEQCATLTGSYTAVPGVSTMTVTEQVGGFATTPSVRPSPEIPSAVSPLPSLIFTPTLDYVRAIITLAGTTPTFPSLSVTVEPQDVAILPSGR